MNEDQSKPDQTLSPGEIKALLEMPAVIERLIEWHQHQATQADAMGYDFSHHDQRTSQLTATRLEAIEIRKAHGYLQDIGEEVIHPATLASKLLDAVRDEATVDDALREMHSVIEDAGLYIAA